MDIPAGIFKSYDIRGTYPDQLNEENAVPITKAIYAFFKKQFPNKEKLAVVVGRDMRTSTPAIFEAVSKTLLELGADVIDPGLVSTPTFYYAVYHYDYDCGMMITASHNPKNYNGIKIVTNPNKGGGIIKIGKPTGMDEIRQMALDMVEPEKASQPGVIHVIEDTVVEEVQSALDIMRRPNLNAFKVAADPANAMGALYVEELYKHIPGELIKLNFELDGTFPSHAADPLDPKNNEPVQEAVKKHGADLGLSLDGDGDRIFFIDEKGKIIQATSITSLIANEILEKSPGEIITADIRDILNVKEVCHRLGGKFTMCIVGHAYITEQLNRENAAFAGESSGHFFFRETGGGESSIRVILYVLNAMNEQNKPISEIISQYITAFEHEEINFVISPPADPQIILADLEKDYSTGHVYKDDGLAVDFPDWRFNVRLSNTENEPILRVNVEGKNKELVDEKFAEIENKMLAAGGKHQ
jgi:phosphomannomutase